ncbi:hypothetical protein AWM75_07310 [Aerococcus urinaehominis]|uniref:Uncharacterized protein n=1 Tax=Aerococcus urinaehominis TaxID=128944 RepID=A0A0X8FM06_9LACT|nr:DUF554 domain-containing protein [Aerococcus urinaehominis]AMB99781.1 hypothetical protein AWM75_07310 [Aerococcus urinaehominis]SDM09231.1 hypothetical protein SAMN04487985_10527 [Aerococcus urinaehominis]
MSIYFGVMVEIAVIFIFTTIGLLLGDFLPDRVRAGSLKAIGAVIAYLGVSGASDSQDLVILIASLLIGTMIGEWLDLEGRLNQGADHLKARFTRQATDTNHSFAHGFVTASIVICVGAMTVLGALNSGLHGDHSLLLAKAVIVAITCIVFGATYGIGTYFASLTVIIYEGGLVTLAAWLAPLLTEPVIAEMSAAGSLILIPLGLNMLEATDIKVTNQIPAIFVPIGLVPLADWLTSLF